MKAYIKLFIIYSISVKITLKLSHFPHAEVITPFDIKPYKSEDHKRRNNVLCFRFISCIL